MFKKKKKDELNIPGHRCVPAQDVCYPAGTDLSSDLPFCKDKRRRKCYTDTADATMDSIYSPRLFRNSKAERFEASPAHRLKMQQV